MIRDRNGERVNPADVLDAYEAGTHPCRGGCGLEVLGIHGRCADCRTASEGDNRCDGCQRALEPDDGGLCWWCIWQLEQERGKEWHRGGDDDAA